MTGFRPKRFDVAGAHPDEAVAAAANVHEAVKEIVKQGVAFKEFPETNEKIRQWLVNKPLRHGDSRDADVQEYLAQGVRNMDGLKQLMPLGLSKSQKEVRGRCNELAKSMEKVLAQRADEPEPFDPWRAVRINVESAPVKDGRVLSANDVREKYRLALRGCFPRGPAQALRSRAVYIFWEDTAERLGQNQQIPEAAKPWQRFVGVIDNMKQRDQAKGIAWGHVDDVEGIDFLRALQPRPVYQAKPRMRM